jgi:hypothetical protein
LWGDAEGLCVVFMEGGGSPTLRNHDGIVKERRS